MENLFFFSKNTDNIFQFNTNLPLTINQMSFKSFMSGIQDRKIMKTFYVQDEAFYSYL